MHRLTVELQPGDGDDRETVLDVDLADVLDVLDVTGEPLAWTWKTAAGAVLRLQIAQQRRDPDTPPTTAG